MLDEITPHPAIGGQAVHGTVADGFEPVREAFAAVLAADSGHAAQVAAYVHGRPVVDLWGGPGMAEDSLIGVFSSGKGAAHLAVALLVQDGTLDLDKEVRHYWPEFAAEGKDTLTLRQLISHQAGLIGTDPGFGSDEILHDRSVAARLAGQRPYWRPGSAHGYHAFTVAALTGEVVFRSTGRTLHEFYAAEIRDARRIDLFLGLPEKHEPRVLDVLPAQLTAEQQRQAAEMWTAPDSIPGVAFNRNGDPLPLEALPNSRAARAAGPASVGGVASARGLARLYAAAISTLDGLPPLLTPDTAAAVAQIQSVGHDLVLREHSEFGLGFRTMGDKHPYLGAGAFGHGGAGGSLAFADPRTGLGFGYIRQRFPFPGGAGPEALALAAAVRTCAIDGAAAQLS
ncbi:serine hydrolase domain-containing protein [Streptomyces sp. NPDC004647]|uniref:serine hydrolase domain-containing protein n=1 Tax=Streptomyces sp. NPDC004647 TaxID=3154671 RepID=UPI0033A1D76D